MKIQKLSRNIVGASLFAAAFYALPAFALKCPPGEVAKGKPAQCVKRDAPKPQLDVEQYSGAQKTQAMACNKVNTARSTIVETAQEIERINTSLDRAQHDLKSVPKGADRTEAKAKVDEWKAKRKAEMAKLKQAHTDEMAATKEHRKALKQVKKEKAASLNCI